MLIKSLAGLIPVRRRMVSLRFRSAVSSPLLCCTTFGLATQGTLTGHPQIDYFNHA
jgi:hypothetical protein